MPPILKHFLRRLLTIPLSLGIITATLYGLLMLAPAEERARLYMPSRLPSRLTDEDIARLLAGIVEQRGLDDPFPLQYGRWITSLLQGNWGYSPVQRMEVLPALLTRVPVTAELALYSILAFIPLGVLSGALAARKPGSTWDSAFRMAAFVGTSLPPFILGLFLLAVFYVVLNWFPPLRLDMANDLLVRSAQFHTFTGLLTIDGLLNGRPDVSLDAFKHLVLPVVTLSLSHYAVLGRLTRATLLDETRKAYILSARARGLPARTVLWRHAFRNALIPALNSTALSAANLVTGVFVVEAVFGFHGLSELITRSLYSTPDVPMAVGFAVFSVLVVLPLMFMLDVIQAIVDPRIREGLLVE
jgi:ABC-type dipeptide/oligopeptide/nickel transport system permease component